MWDDSCVTKLPAKLSTSPMTLARPLCGAKPGKHCETVSGISLPIVHVQRIEAAVRTDAAAAKKRTK
jgi:hypothetical protein